MYIVQIASECSPVIKAGGLGDVVYGLSRELELRGHTVELILPKYDCMQYEHIWGLHHTYKDLKVPWHDAAVRCDIHCGWVHGRLCFFIEPDDQDNWFKRNQYYGYDDDAMRFAFFSKAALEFLQQSNKRPDIIHCHDWQTGLVPVMLFEIYQYHGMEDQRVCYTIQNFKHQGIAGTEVLWATGLNREPYYFRPERLQDTFNPFALNYMKGGITYGNAVTTVSPHYAWEAHHGDLGYGLGHTLHLNQRKFTGILNGIDYNLWNPQLDKYIAERYSPEILENKLYNKKALRERFMLSHGNQPIVAFIGPLNEQKGMHLVHHAMYRALDRGAQFVLLGSPSNNSIREHFQHEKTHQNENQNCHLELGFDDELSHLVYAGADIMLVPSNVEPCGLAQLISLKYGTVPIVRGVGGLVDTVFDIDYNEGKPPEKRNGFVFYQSDNYALESALDRALDLWYQDLNAFQNLQRQGMDYDYSWNLPGEQYIKIYDAIRYR